MASDASFIDYLRDQLGAAGALEFKKMFGEYAVYCDGKVVALVCDNQLFIKPTQAGRAALEPVVEAPPYPGAKPHFLVQEQLDDRAAMSHAIRITAAELPAPRPKPPKPPKARKPAA